MNVKIDWYEFVYPTGENIGAIGQGALERVRQHLKEVGITLISQMIDVDEWEQYPGRGVWSTRYQGKVSGVSISVSTKRGGFKVELPGDACSQMWSSGGLLRLLEITSAWVTRIDLAIDIQTGALGTAEFAAYVDFASQETVKTRKSLSEAHSASGDTFYFGSWNSSRFARVYHFHPPHERSEFVRFEVVYKSDYAKNLLQAHTPISVQSLVKSAHLPYMWKVREIEDFDAVSFDVTVPRSDKTSGSHVRWLLTVCIPSLAKALAVGEITQAYLDTHLYNEIPF